MTYGVFEPLMEEHTYEVEQIDGALPAGLSGTLYRIGPGKWQVGGTMLDCLFDGDGMVSQFAIDDGVVRFRNRYMRTPQFQHGMTSSTLRRPGIGTPVPGARLPRPPANTANTNVSIHAGDLLALWEGGKPHRLDPDTLETLGEHDFGGRLKGLGMWSAHPRYDPATGEMFNFGLRFLPTPGLNCYKVARDGKTTRIASLPIRGGLPWLHDFGLTERYLVFVLSPTLPNLKKILGGGSFVDALDYDPTRSTKFVLVPRRGGRPRVIEHPALFTAHMTNAYDDGTDTVIELIRYPGFDSLKADLLQFRTAFQKTRPNALVRYRITATRVIEEELTTHPCELPQFDRRVGTRRHRYSYLSGQCAGEGGLFDSVLKVDHDTTKVTARTLGDCVGEPIFVPRTPDAAEDDGWLLTVDYVEAEHRSQLLVLDASSLDLLATVQLPHHIPFGFHGGFTRRVAAAGSPVPHPGDIPAP